LWLYKIATTTYLNALQMRKRRPLPSGLSAPADSARIPLAAAQTDIPWLQPAPDSLLYGATDDPAVVVSHRSTVRLAFIAALQHLSPLQRAVLVLRDVLGWRAKEVAEMLDTSTVAVNSALQRARTQLAQAHPARDVLSEPTEPEVRNVLDRYMAAFDTPTSMHWPSCFELMSNSKCLRFQRGSPDAMRCVDSWLRWCCKRRVNGG
jgi:RNA polymerase sigma-70 factor (ECF subfamily)